MADQQEEQVSLSVNDLILLSQIVQVSADRGAIKAGEMEQVGAVYGKLMKFLEASGASKQPEPPAGEEEPATGEDQ